MVLLLNATNRIIQIGVFDGKNLILTEEIGTNKKSTAFELYNSFCLVLSSLKEEERKAINSAFFSCVVPSLEETIKNALKRLVGDNILVLKSGIKTGLDMRLDDVAAVGGDFILGCVGALQILKPPILVIDADEVLLTSLVDENKSFIGRTISPGLYMSLSSLCEKTERLCHTSLIPEKELSLFGKTTSEALQSGIVKNTALSLNERVREVKKLYPEIKIVLTGSEAEILKNHFDFSFTFEKNLSLIGLSKIYLKNKI